MDSDRDDLLFWGLAFLAMAAVGIVCWLGWPVGVWS